MNEPKRRGRPPKAKAELVRVDLTAEVMADETGFDREPFRSEEKKAAFADRVIDPVEVFAEPVSLEQAYARRIWNGQSPDLSRHERLGRIAEALKAQGMSMEGVELP